MIDPAIGGVITRHIDELEAAIRYAHNVMQPTLGKALAHVIDKRKASFGWAGAIDEDLDEQSWLAPEDWRTADDREDHFDLYIDFDYTDCIDGGEPETWLGVFCGFAGAGLRFTFGTNALGARGWKALLRSEAEIVEALVAQGFRCDPKDGDLAVLVSLDRAALATAFEEQDFEAALQPIAAALDRIEHARRALDRLVAAIRKQASA